MTMFLGFFYLGISHLVFIYNSNMSCFKYTNVYNVISCSILLWHSKSSGI